MNCPRCAKGMGEILSQGVLIDFCTACKGAWLDQGEARFFAADPVKVEAALAGELRNPHPSKIKCPRCTGAMTEGGVFTDDYLLDRCNDCHGVWFDGRELSRLRDAKLVGLDPVSSRSSRPRGAMAGPVAANAPTTSSAAYLGGGPADALSASIDAASHADGGAPTFNAAALAAAIPAIPNLALRSASVFGGLAFIMGGIFIAATLAAGLHPALAVIFTLVFIGIQYAVGPFILDLSLRWMNGLRWMTRAEIPPHIARFLDDACKKNGVKFPHLGIIEDGAPNAFTYGHTPNNARIVITRGILNLLNEEEADAVVAHELGHVVHWDAVVMTLAGCVPILCYGIYRACIRAGRGSRKNGQYAWAVALVAYVLYIVAEYLVLMLSRTREYYADRFSAEATGNPNALASALVKVAYGLVSNENAIAQGQQQARPAAMAAGGGGMRAFGIFDPTAARNLAAASYAGGSFSRENLVGAMQWDLWNPWARWFELHSTHPLPARRLQALAGESLKRGQLPLIVFDKTQPESYWDEFAVDVFIKLLPVGLALILAAAALSILGPGALLGGAVMGYGVGKLASTMFMYHTDSEQDGYPMASTAALLKVVKVSPVRGVPARLKGKVIGRGNPGHILSEDVVLQDKTGILFLDYRTIFSPMSWWFALSKVPQIMGQDVEARGWYRRGPAPYFELREIRWAGGSKTSWIYPAKLVWGGVCTIGGAFLTFAGFLAVL